MSTPFRTAILSIPAPALAADAGAVPERVEDIMDEARTAVEADARLRGWINHHDERVPLALIGGTLAPWLARHEGWSLHLYARAMRDAERDDVCWTPLLDRMAVTGIWPTQKGRVVLGGKVSVVTPVPVAQVIEPLRRWLREQTDGAALAPLAAFHATPVRALIQSRLAVLPAVASFTGEYPTQRAETVPAEQRISTVGIGEVAAAAIAATPVAETPVAAPTAAPASRAATASAATASAAAAPASPAMATARPATTPSAATPMVAAPHAAVPLAATPQAAAGAAGPAKSMAQILAEPLAPSSAHGSPPSIAQILAAAPAPRATPSITDTLLAPAVPAAPATPTMSQILAAPAAPSKSAILDALNGPVRAMTPVTPMTSGPVPATPIVRTPAPVASAPTAAIPVVAAEPMVETEAVSAAPSPAPPAAFGPHGVAMHAATDAAATPAARHTPEPQYTPEQLGGLMNIATGATGRTDESQVRPEIRKAINTLIEYKALPSEKLYNLYSACRLVKTWVVRIVAHVAATIELWRAALRDNNWIEVREAIVKSASARRDSVIRLILSRCGSSEVLCALCLDGDMPDVPQIARRVRTVNPHGLLDALLTAARTTGLRMTASDLSPLVHHEDPEVRQQAMALLHLMVRPA